MCYAKKKNFPFIYVLYKGFDTITYIYISKYINFK